MMPGLCRVSDMGSGICPHHKHPVSYITTFITGSENTNTNGSPQCFIASIGVSSCGHTTIMLTGSPNVNVNGSPAARVGDTGINYGPYTVITGSPNTNANV